MPILLSRQLSTASLAAIVEKCQRQPGIQSPLEYDLQLRNNQLDLVLLSKPPESVVPTKPQKPVPPPKPNGRELSKSPVLSKGSTSTSDEGFESDIDTISLISSENECFSVEKIVSKPNLTETDSANGGSGTESETETEKTNTLTQKNVNSIKEGFERQALMLKSRETFDLVDCVCYSDVTYPDVLIFVIKNEALVFKFDSLDKLQTFYTNFTTVKAVTNQKTYNFNKNVANKYNLLQRTDQNGVTHIEIKKQNSIKHLLNRTESGPSSIISVDTLNGTVSKKLLNIEDPKFAKVKDVNLRQRADSQLINDIQLLNDVKFNTINNKVGQKKMITRSSSIENILNIDNKGSNLVKDSEVVGTLRKVWNSAEDLLDSDTPRRPERRRKKKPAPLPPTKPEPSSADKVEDVFRGQFVRVNVNIDPSKEFHDKNRLIIKSSGNEPHPKKLGQNFNLLGRNNFASLLKSNKTESVKLNNPISRYPQETVTLNRPQRTPLYEKNNSWTNSVPRILKKSSRSKSETRNTHQNFQPMAYRYIDTTSDHPYNPAAQNNAVFLTATGLRPKSSTETLQRKIHSFDPIHHQPRISFAYNVGTHPKHQENAMGNRVFGLTPKIKDFSKGETSRGGNRWASTSDLTFLADRDKNNLKSSIKSGEGVGKKKNEKKVTFSAYTTVQVV